eukprot:16862-Chlamydomonas_euryale.AAC.6
MLWEVSACACAATPVPPQQQQLKEATHRGHSLTPALKHKGWPHKRTRATALQVRREIGEVRRAAQKAAHAIARKRQPRNDLEATLMRVAPDREVLAAVRGGVGCGVRGVGAGAVAGCALCQAGRR